MATAWTVRGSTPGGGRDFPHLSRPPMEPTILLYNGYRVFPGVKSGRDVTLTPHPLLVPWSRKSRAIPLLSRRAVGPVQSLSACTRVHVTLPLHFNVLFRVYIYIYIYVCVCVCVCVCYCDEWIVNSFVTAVNEFIKVFLIICTFSVK